MQKIDTSENSKNDTIYIEQNKEKRLIVWRELLKGGALSVIRLIEERALSVFNCISHRINGLLGNYILRWMVTFLCQLRSILIIIFKEERFEFTMLTK